jgi:hypothetical protein
MDYDPDTGIFMWKRLWPGIKIGAAAGLITKRGYRNICVDRRSYRSGRLVWLYVYGSWPKGQIDHKNSIRHDDRLANLRDVTPSINKENMHKASYNNKTGFLGVRRDRNRYRATIVVNGRCVHVGTFDTAEAAYSAYILAKRQLHQGCML